MKLVGHIDCDCYYVSAERVRRPELRNIPVGVMSNQGACIIAKSYELKAAGVSTAMAIWEALPLCPEAVYVKRDFEWYEVLSRKILEVVRSVSPAVEFYSIDEQFFDASCLESHFRTDVDQSTKLLQSLVLEVTGVPVSIGVAPTKTYAKLISKSVKPFGCGAITNAEDALSRFSSTPTSEITGVGSRSKRKLLGYSIATVGEFARAERKFIRKLLTKTGEELWWELNGTQTKPILTSRPPNKMIARGGSVGKSTANEDKLLAWVARNIERMIEALDYHQVHTEELSFVLCYKSGLSFSEKLTLPQATAEFRLLFEAAQRMFKELFSYGNEVRRMHLIAGKLSYRTKSQKSLFHTQSTRDKKIARAKRQINEKVGRFALRSGVTLPLYELYHDEASDHETCDIYGTTCF